MAMLKHLDAGVGRVVEALKKEGVWQNTLLFFLTDNGGSKAMHAVNTPLRGFKQQNYEGGIRTPFIVSWPRRFRGGRTMDTVITSLDILATALDAAGVKPPVEKPLDGQSLLSVLGGESKALHDSLFWSEGGLTGEWAVRSGSWKLVTVRAKKELFDLAADPSERNDLAAKKPDKVKELSELYERWLDQMAEPVKSGAKRWTEGDATESREKRIERRRRRKGKPARADSHRSLETKDQCP